jgi:Fur family transcriptional regulator, ferric uptake regulator
MDDNIRATLENYLAAQGLRRTKQRDIIVETAFATDEHFTAEELIDRVRKLDASASRATVYRTLSLMVECGLLHEIHLGKDQTYYDPNFLQKPEHNHLICVDCDKVVEFEDEHIAVLEECITRRLGFRSIKKSIHIEAKCEELAREGVCSKSKVAPV